jgi:hypothetical protein
VTRDNVSDTPVHRRCRDVTVLMKGMPGTVLPLASFCLAWF